MTTEAILIYQSLFPIALGMGGLDRAARYESDSEQPPRGAEAGAEDVIFSKPVSHL